MLFANQYSKTQVVYPGNEITVRDLRAFRARVGLALAASDSVTLDLTQTQHLDSWSLLAILDQPSRPIELTADDLEDVSVSRPAIAAVGRVDRRPPVGSSGRGSACSRGAAYRAGEPVRRASSGRPRAVGR